jgi:hypothetical protein
VGDEKWWEGEGAPSGEEPGEDLFSKLDTDGDGVVTRDEFENAMDQGPTLTGEVSTIVEDDGSIMGPPGDEGSAGGLSDSTWFVIGLIGAPIALGVLSLVLTVISDSLYGGGWFYDDDSFLSAEETVQFSGEDYTVFQADFDGVPDDVDWYSMSVQWYGDYAGDHADCWGESESVMPIVSDDGRGWNSMECWGENDGDVYMRLDGSTGSFATKRSDSPDWADIDGEEAGASSGQGIAAAIGFLGAAVVPVGLVAGMVWGFTKGPSSFAYGMLASVVVLPLVVLGLCVIVFFALIGSGGGF